MDNDKKIDKGTYCLIINVDKDVKIKIGAKGFISFNKGYYVYVGSALNNLSKRIERHISKDKKKHWHMDYFSLNKNVKIEQVIYIHSLKKVECNISSYLNKISEDYIGSFGCSDCNCESHLYYFDSFENAVKSSEDAFKNLEFNPIKWF